MQHCTQAGPSIKVRSGRCSRGALELSPLRVPGTPGPGPLCRRWWGTLHLDTELSSHNSYCDCGWRLKFPTGASACLSIMGSGQSVPKDSPLACVLKNLKPLSLTELKANHLKQLYTDPASIPIRQSKPLAWVQDFAFQYFIRSH